MSDHSSPTLTGAAPKAAPAPGTGEVATVHTDRKGQIENVTTNEVGHIEGSSVNISSGNIGGSAM